MNSNSKTKQEGQSAWPRTGFTFACAIFFMVAVAATGYRVYKSHYPGPKIAGNKKMGFCDFYNGVYYPTQAFLNRDNPYRPEIDESYPISRHVPFYSPLIFIIHSPIALLPKSMAAVSYFVLLIGLVFATSRFAVQLPSLKDNWGWAFLVAGCLLFTRPGQNSVFNGYFTLELILGALCALHFGKTRPWLAALGLAICSIKPTYAIPLFFLMVCRGHWRSALLGTGIATICCAAGLAWISDHQSLADIRQTIDAAQSSHHEFPNIWPVNTWTRLDTLAVVAKWNQWRPNDDVHLAVMMGMLLLPCAIIAWSTRRATRVNLENQGSAVCSELDVHGGYGIIGLICILAMLVSIYHHSYDSVILVVPIVGLILARWSRWATVGMAHRIVLVILLLVPFVNYLSSRSVIDKLGLEDPAFTVVTSVNGICLTLALLYSCLLAVARTKTSAA